jgi:hypothetical protein
MSETELDGPSEVRVARVEEVGRTVRFIFGCLLALSLVVGMPLAAGIAAGLGESETTERMTVCVENGGSWNEGQGDCVQ